MYLQLVGIHIYILVFYYHHQRSCRMEMFGALSLYHSMHKGGGFPCDHYPTCIVPQHTEPQGPTQPPDMGPHNKGIPTKPASSPSPNIGPHHTGTPGPSSIPNMEPHCIGTSLAPVPAPPPHMVKLVQLGPHCTGTPWPQLQPTSPRHFKAYSL